MSPFFWMTVILVSAGTAFCITWPMRKKLTGLENMCEMLSRALRGEFRKK